MVQAPVDHRRETIAAVLISWKRPWNIPKIVTDLAGLRLFDEIIVWDNSSIMEKPAGCRFMLINSDENYCTYGRFLAAKQASSDIIYTQDDDCLTGDYTEKLILRYLNDQSKIVAGLKEGHHKCETGENQKPWLQLGWGSVFRKTAVSVLDQYIERFGVDDVLKRKADRIFTALHGRHDPVIVNPIRLFDPNGRISETNEDALYKRPDHHRMTQRAIERVNLLMEDCHEDA